MPQKAQRAVTRLTCRTDATRRPGHIPSQGECSSTTVSHCLHQQSAISVADSGFSDGSDVIEQGHEPEIHMKLLVAMEQRQARIVSDEIDFRFLIAPQHDDVFENSG